MVIHLFLERRPQNVYHPYSLSKVISAETEVIFFNCDNHASNSGFCLFLFTWSWK